MAIDGQLVLDSELAILYGDSLTGHVDVARLLNNQDIAAIESQLDALTESLCTRSRLAKLWFEYLDCTSTLRLFMRAEL